MNTRHFQAIKKQSRLFGILRVKGQPIRSAGFHPGRLPSFRSFNKHEAPVALPLHVKPVGPACVCVLQKPSGRREKDAAFLYPFRQVPESNRRLPAQRPFAVTDFAEMGVQDADSSAFFEEVEDIRREDAPEPFRRVAGTDAAEVGIAADELESAAPVPERHFPQ